MYDGTLAEDWRALITFQQLIVLCDADGVIDMTPHAIARRTGIPLEHIKAGIEILQSPDPESRTEGEEGRRIVPIDAHRPWGWRIVNHEKYKQLRDYDTVRAQTRERVRRHREGAEGVTQSNPDVTHGNADVTRCNGQKRHTDTDTDIKHTSNLKRFDAFWSAYPKKVEKKKAKAIWQRRKLDRIADQIIENVKTRKARDPQWERGYIPNPTSYLNGDRWEDELAQTVNWEQLVAQHARKGESFEQTKARLQREQQH